LFVAFKVAGKTTNAYYPRHRHQEFLCFLKQVANAHPARKLHIPLGNYGIPEHPTVQAWLERHPRITLHFTSVSGF
jgi:hypothetical protein